MSAAAAVNGGDAAKQTPSLNTSNKPPTSRTNGPSLSYNAGGSASANGKTLDNTRRSAGSPQTDANHSRKPPPRAWQTHNPLIRGNNINGTPSPANSTPNGASAHQQPNKAAPTPQRATSESSPSLTDKQAHDRTLYLLANLVGRDVTLTLKSGETFTGVYFGSSPSAGAAASSPSKFQHLLKMVRRGGDGGEYVGEGEDFSMAVDVQETQVLSALEVPLTTTTSVQHHAAAAGTTANGARFMTDTQISNRDHNGSQRPLQRWTPGLESSSSSIGTALEESSSSSAGWDQFAANEKLYGVESTYDESIYTTAINRQDPNFRRRQQEADRIAREIEASAPATAHVAEERREHDIGGAAAAGAGEDEEEKYSGVLRRDISSTPAAASSLPKRAAGAYVPPSQRAIANAPTVPGAPFDPAIISTQLDPSPIPPTAPASGQQQQSASSAAPASAAPTDPSQRAVPADTTTATRPTAITTATAPAVAAVKDNKSSGGPVTTEAIVRETADAFKQFVGNEKMRLQQARHQAQEAKRSTVRAEKTVKLNDLKKFAANFKLHSRVPDDLVPILAKDRDKQLEIQSKAEEAAKENESKAKEKEEKAKETPSAAATPAAAAATATTTAPALQPPSAPSQLPSGDARAYQQHPRGRGSQQGGRGGFGPAGGAPAQSPRIPLGQRIQGNLQYYPQQQQQQQQQQMPPPPQPSPFDRPRSDLRIPSTVSAASDSASPASATTRLNVNAKAFEFRPGASTFAPSAAAGGASQSPPRRGSAAAKKPEPAPRAFFDSEEARLAPCVPATFDPLDWLINTKDLDDKKKQQAAANGGVLHSYTTLPTWGTIKENANVLYLAAFTKQPASSSSSSSQGPMPVTPLRQPSIGVIPPQFNHAGGYHPQQQQHQHHANGLTAHHHPMLPHGAPQAIPMHLAGPQRSQQQQQHFYPQPPPHMMAPQFTHHPHHLPPHLQQQPGGYNMPMLGSSPRQQQAYAAAQAGMPFGGQMAQMGGAPPPFAVAQHPGQQAPAPYAGSPGMTFRQLSNTGPGAAGPPQMMMMPGGGGGPPRGYAGAHMMAQQASQQGAYSQQQQQSQFSSPMPQHAQPMTGGGPGGPGGYMQQQQQSSSSPYQGSPRPMMMQHQGSHQGYNPNNHPNHMGARQMSNGFVAGPSAPAQQQHQQMGTPRGAQAFPMQAQGSQSQHQQQQQQPNAATAPPLTANGSATAAAAAESGK